MAEKIVRMSIALKAAIFVALLFAMCAIFVISLNVFAERQVSLAEVRQRAEQFAQSSATLAIDSIASGDVAVLSRWLEQVQSQPDVDRAYLLGADGRVLAAGSRGAVTTADRIATQAWANNEPLCIVGEEHVHVALPIERDGAFLGVLRLTMSLDQLYARETASLRRNIWLNLLGLSLALPLTGLAIARMMRPVRKLTEASERVASRDLNTRIDVRTGDELEVLAAAFNEMMEQLKSSMDRIRWLAFVDDLTRLPNKTAFLEHAKRAANDAASPGAVLLIDLDRFKRLNDTYGEREGDRVLASAAARITKVVKALRDRTPGQAGGKSPVLARLSGDEFALLMCAPAPSVAAKDVAQDIIAALRAPMEIANQEVHLTASVGIARFPVDASESDLLMRQANLALDAAKADGGGAYRFFEPEMTRRAVERLTLENELRRAVAEREFEVHYQPKVNARTGRITGCEALVRWRRHGELVGPGAFIQAAEESGLILDIGDFVLREACLAAARWREAGFLPAVAVNVSAIQLECETFSRTVIDALGQANLTPDALELELTESVATQHPEQVINQIEPLRSQGVRFAIDDFGTGYSSLGTLTRLPFDVFKIDQSFVRSMESDSNARVVIETIIAMARALGYDTVAEGVETEAQFAFLRLNGCTSAQGWYFGKPMSEADFVAQLEAERDSAAAAEDAVATELAAQISRLGPNAAPAAGS